MFILVAKITFSDIAAMIADMMSAKADVVSANLLIILALANFPFNSLRSAVFRSGLSTDTGGFAGSLRDHS